MSRAPKKPPPVKLEFTTNSVRNTTISVADDRFHYEVVTRFWHPTVTKIFKFDVEENSQELIAEIERHATLCQDRVRLGGETAQWVDATEFLRREENGATTWVSAGGEEFKWDGKKQKLQLVKSSENGVDPVARFHPPKRHFFVFRMSKHAWLEVQPDALDALDQMIISYLLVERKRRHGKANAKATM